VTKDDLVKMLGFLDSIQDIYDGDDMSNPTVTRFDTAVSAFRRYVVRELARIEAMQARSWNGAK